MEIKVNSQGLLELSTVDPQEAFKLGRVAAQLEREDVYHRILTYGQGVSLSIGLEQNKEN